MLESWDHETAKRTGESTVRIGVLGTGYVGGALGRRWAEAGHDVKFGSRDPNSEKAVALREQCPDGVEIVSWADASRFADVILLALPWPTIATALQQIQAIDDSILPGKVLIDCSNPLNETFSGLALGFDTSAAEEIARWAPSSSVVKAFNTVSAAAMVDPHFEGRQAAVFYCGDDDAALDTVRQLAEDLQFDPIAAGPLKNARYLEPFAMLYIHLAMNGWGSNCAFQMLTRPKPT